MKLLSEMRKTSGVLTLKRFVLDRRGSSIVMMGLAMLVLVGAAGIAVDTGRGYYLKARLNQAVDAAALAGSSAFSESGGHKAVIEKFFAANLPDGVMGAKIQKPVIEVSPDGEQIVVTATAQVPTTLMRVLGADGLTVSASSTANRSVGGTELVMVLDTTGSMGFGSSWPKAKAAMSSMLKGLEEISGGEGFYVTFVPMADRIRVGSDKSAWLGVPAPSGWKGCMEPREEDLGAFPYALTDKTPSELSFLPTASGYYTSDLATKGWFSCPAEILGPTSDASGIEAAINKLGLKGTGRMDLGMAWAWRLLSPKWQGLWSVADYPADYGDRRKVVVYITDMYTEAYRYEVGGEDEGRLFGWNQGGMTGFEHFVEVCRNMKDEGIEIHTVYANGNTHGVPYISDCASGAAYFHEVSDVASLKTTLEEITASVTRVWLGN